MKYLYIIQQAMVWILTIYWVYQLIVSLCSLVKLKDKPLVEEKDHKFMAILPAHNEENVIGNLIESLKKQDYPANLIDIYVIADNCTDNTVKIAKEAGAIVLERKEDEWKNFVDRRENQLTYQLVQYQLSDIVLEEIIIRGFQSLWENKAMHFSKKAMMTRMQDLLIEEKMELTKSKTWILIEANIGVQGVQTR